MCANRALDRAALTVGAGPAQAWSVSGSVYCDANGNSQGDLVIDTPLSGVLVTLSGGASATTTTDAAGFYSLDLPDTPAAFQVGVTPPNGAGVIIPGSNPFPFSTTDAQRHVDVNFLLSQTACSPPPPPPPGDKMLVDRAARAVSEPLAPCFVRESQNLV